MLSKYVADHFSLTCTCSAVLVRIFLIQHFTYTHMASCNVAFSCMQIIGSDKLLVVILVFRVFELITDMVKNAISATDPLIISTFLMPLPNFDGLWYMILKLLTKKRDPVTIQGVVHISVITQWQLVPFSSEIVTS